MDALLQLLLEGIKTNPSDFNSEFVFYNDFDEEHDEVFRPY